MWNVETCARSPVRFPIGHFAFVLAIDRTFKRNLDAFSRFKPVATLEREFGNLPGNRLEIGGSRRNGAQTALVQ